jgi:hypothetical protein
MFLVICLSQLKKMRACSSFIFLSFSFFHKLWQELLKKMQSLLVVFNARNVPFNFKGGLWSCLVVGGDSTRLVCKWRVMRAERSTAVTNGQSSDNSWLICFHRRFIHQQMRQRVICSFEITHCAPLIRRLHYTELTHI